MINYKQEQRKVLFFTSITEFGERYSYYVIQSLLIFFLLDKFHLSQEHSASLVGTALGMIYISSIIGGYIADKLLGAYPSAILGCIIMSSGCFILTMSSHINLLYLGLALISISTGLIKSNMSTFLGQFYDQVKLPITSREGGFYLFYVGINCGSLFALFFASLLKDHYGFAVPFYSSLIIMLLITINLIYGYFKLTNYIKFNCSIAKIITTILLILAYIGLVVITLMFDRLAQLVIMIASIACCIVLIKSAQKKYWYKVAFATLFFVLSIIYWSIYFQTFISLLIFIDKCVNHQLLAFNCASSQFLAIESVGVITIGMVIGKLWKYLSAKNIKIYAIDKFNFGFIGLALMFLIIYLAIHFSATNTLISGWIIVLAMLIASISELCLSAVGLSLITKLAPEGYVSLYMGIWLVTLGIGGKLAGFLSSDIIIADNLPIAKHNMAYGCGKFILLALIASIVCWCFRKLAIRYAHLMD
jgi:POT family proton-dependent oligopeptide transporter